MGADLFEVSVNLIKLIAFFLLMVQCVPILVWVERRGSAFIQNRFGPNRVGPLGLLQLLADAVKFAFKEQFIPAKAEKFLYLSAPVLALIPAALAFAAIPFSAPIQIEPFVWGGKQFGPYVFDMQGINIHMGIIYILAVSSLGAYGLLAAGWGSGNKYSLFGALRASAQMISYELAMGLAILGSILIYGTFNLTEMIVKQDGPLSFMWGGSMVTPPLGGWIPNWGIFYQPIAAIIYLTATFAETNRLPFDLPESEGELVAGFHTEYGGFKLLLFFMGEYGHMLVACSLFTIFYLGGYGVPGITTAEILAGFVKFFGSVNVGNIVGSLALMGWFLFKVAIFMWLFIWVRWTLPRFRYDQLMNFGWKTLLPWALTNAAVTAVVLYFTHRQ